MLLYQLSLFCTKKYQPSPESDGIVTKPIDNEGAKASSQSLGKRGLGIWFLFGWKRLNRGMWEFSCSSCSCSSWSSLIHPRLNVPPSAGKSSTCLIWTASLSPSLSLSLPLSLATLWKEISTSHFGERMRVPENGTEGGGGGGRLKKSQHTIDSAIYLSLGHWVVCWVGMQMFKHSWNSCFFSSHLFLGSSHVVVLFLWSMK